MPAITPLILSSLAASNISLTPSTTSTSISSPNLVQRAYPDWAYDWPETCKIQVHSATPSPCPGALYTSAVVDYELRYTVVVLVPYTLPPPGEPIKYVTSTVVDGCEYMPQYYPVATIFHEGALLDFGGPGMAAAVNFDSGSGSGSSLGPVTQTDHGNEKHAPTPALAAADLPAVTDCQMHPLREVFGAVKTVGVTVTKTTGGAFGQSQATVVTADGNW